jgi:hypothetical protein
VRHRACACDRRPHRLIRVTFTAAVLALVAVTALRIGTAIGSADLVARITGPACVDTASAPALARGPVDPLRSLSSSCYSTDMPKRTIAATAPDGTAVSVSVGPRRAVGAIRITNFTWRKQEDGSPWWVVSVHKSLELAITGSNQTPEWNSCPRWAIAIGPDDQPAGTWQAASK